MGGLSEILDRVAEAAARAGRDAGDISLVAVTKTASPGAIRAAYDAGHRDFGENREAGLVAGSQLLPCDARWHMIGRLQGNKVRKVRPIVTLLHSLDRPELAGYWAKGSGHPPPVLVQVNIGGDPRKAGVAPEGAAELVEFATGLGLDVVGLMTVPPLTGTPEGARPLFRAMAVLRDRLASVYPGLTGLSMGMTDDFEVAVEEGATILRVGRAIFGAFEENQG